MWADPTAIERETQRVEAQAEEAGKDEARSSAVPPFVPLPPGVAAAGPPPSPGNISREISVEGAAPLKPAATDAVVPATRP